MAEITVDSKRPLAYIIIEKYEVLKDAKKILHLAIEEEERAKRDKVGLYIAKARRIRSQAELDYELALIDIQMLQDLIELE